jgi:hypothetical protein
MTGPSEQSYRLHDFRRLAVLWVFLAQGRIGPAPALPLTPTNATGGHAGEDFGHDDGSSGSAPQIVGRSHPETVTECAKRRSAAR